MSNEKLRGIFDETKILVSKKENPYWRAYFSNGYGEDKGEHIELAIIEALHLIDRGILEVIDKNGKKITREKLFNMIDKAGDWALYIIYKDLRNRGYTIKLTSVAPIRILIYPRGKNILEASPLYGVFIAEASKEVKLTELDTAVKVSREKNIGLLIGIVDEVGDVTYYEIEETLEEK